MYVPDHFPSGLVAPLSGTESRYLQNGRPAIAKCMQIPERALAHLAGARRLYPPALVMDLAGGALTVASGTVRARIALEPYHEFVLVAALIEALGPGYQVTAQATTTFDAVGQTATYNAEGVFAVQLLARTGAGGAAVAPGVTEVMLTLSKSGLSAFAIRLRSWVALPLRHATISV